MLIWTSKKVFCVVYTRYLRIRSTIYSSAVYRNLPIRWILKMRVNILLSSCCWWWARFLRWSLFDVQGFFSEVLVFCSRILSVLMYVPPHRRGTSDYLLIWTCADMIFFSPWPETIAVNSDVIGIFNFSLCSAVKKNDQGEFKYKEHSLPFGR